MDQKVSKPFSEYTEMERALLGELAEIEQILAEALGFDHHENYGWNVGDHTAVTLAMEVRGRGVKGERG